MFLIATFQETKKEEKPFLRFKETNAKITLMTPTRGRYDGLMNRVSENPEIVIPEPDVPNRFI
jgi:hypothetical protein